MAQRRDAVDDMLEQWGRERPDLDRSGMGIVLRVLILAGAFSARLKEILAPLDLAPWEFDVLSALRRAGGVGRAGGVSAKDLCGSGRLTSGAMTHRLDRLEERGLVRRRASHRDRRSVTISLTPKGLSIVDRAVGARMADALECLGPLNQKDRRSLTRMLRELSGDLEPPAPRG